MMCSDGSLCVSKSCDVSQSAASHKSTAAGKGKSRATAGPMNTAAAAEVELKPRTYMGFLMRFIHKELFIRNTQQSIDEEYGMTQVLTDTYRQTERHTDTETDIQIGIHTHRRIQQSIDQEYGMTQVLTDT